VRLPIFCFILFPPEERDRVPPICSPYPSDPHILQPTLLVLEFRFYTLRFSPSSSFLRLGVLFFTKTP